MNETQLVAADFDSNGKCFFHLNALGFKDQKFSLICFELLLVQIWFIWSIN